MWSGKRKVVVLLVKRLRIMYEIVVFSVHLSFIYDGIVELIYD